jgi:hypothetical protein
MERPTPVSNCEESCFEGSEPMLLAPDEIRFENGFVLPTIRTSGAPEKQIEISCPTHVCVEHTDDRIGLRFPELLILQALPS